MSVQPQAMDRAGSEVALQPYPNLFVKQTKKGCLQECCGCEANTEFKISTKEQKDNDILYAIENTSCCLRCCCPSNRPFKITVSQGGKKGGAKIATYDRAWACPVSCCKCCCRQRVYVTSYLHSVHIFSLIELEMAYVRSCREVKNEQGHSLGNITETCWWCVPKFAINRPNGTTEYKIHPPTCCCGTVVNVCAAGCCNCKVPFDIIDHDKGEKVGRITKVWSGLGKELLTDADNFETDFPVYADGASKARILGAVFLLNQVFFESKSPQGAT